MHLVIGAVKKGSAVKFRLLCALFFALLFVGHASAANDGLALYKHAWQLQQTRGQTVAQAWVDGLPAQKQAAIQAVFARDLSISPIETERTKSAIPPIKQSHPSDFQVAAFSAASSGCYGYYTVSTWQRSQITGSFFWMYSQQLYWCGQSYAKSGYITYFVCGAWASNLGFGWYFTGSTIYCAVTAGGRGYTGVQEFSQGRFCTSGCGSVVRPSLRQTGYWNGSYVA